MPSSSLVEVEVEVEIVVGVGVGVEVEVEVGVGVEVEVGVCSSVFLLFRVCVGGYDGLGRGGWKSQT